MRYLNVDGNCLLTWSDRSLDVYTYKNHVIFMATDVETRETLALHLAIMPGRNYAGTVL